MKSLMKFVLISIFCLSFTITKNIYADLVVGIDKRHKNSAEYAVAKALAAEMGEKLVIRELDIMYLVTGKFPSNVDIVLGRLPVTKRYLPSHDFITTIYHIPSYFAVHKNTKKIRTKHDLDGELLGARSGTIYERYLDRKLKNVGKYKIESKSWVDGRYLRMYTSLTEAIKDLSVGEGVYLNGVLSDKKSIKKMIRRGHPVKLLDDVVFHTAFTVATSHYDAHNKDRILKAVKNLRQKGILSRISYKYFDEDLSKK